MLQRGHGRADESWRIEKGECSHYMRGKSVYGRGGLWMSGRDGWVVWLLAMTTRRPLVVSATLKNMTVFNSAMPTVGDSKEL